MNNISLEGNLIDASSEGSKIPVLSFFTGGGFLDMGFEKAGFDVCWTNEVNPVFARMYEYGMTRWRQAEKLFAGPAKISELKSIEDIPARRTLKKAFPFGTPEIFGVIGGPPCPDFSNGGKNHGGDGKLGRLSKIFIHSICKIRPHFFVFENVPALFRTNVHRQFLSELEDELEKNGFTLDMKILNALELGVPQDRERLIVIGFRKNLARHCAGRRIKTGERDWFPWPQVPKYANAKSRFPWPDKTARGIEPALPEGIPEELTVCHILKGAEPSERQPNGTEGFKPYSVRFKTILEGDTKRKSFKRLHRYRYSPTVCYGHNEVHLHPWEDRRLTVREAMRIQGIPDTYALPAEDPLGPKFTIIANGFQCRWRTMLLCPCGSSFAYLLRPRVRIRNRRDDSMGDIWSREKRSQVMSRIRSKNTLPERIVRSTLYSMGYRYRLHVRALPGQPDIVLNKYKTVIFVHGCFWHLHNGCRDGTVPKTRTSYWKEKLYKNKNRDVSHFRALRRLGWRVLRVWECDVERRPDKIRLKLQKLFET